MLSQTRQLQSKQFKCQWAHLGEPSLHQLLAQALPRPRHSAPPVKDLLSLRHDGVRRDLSLHHLDPSACQSMLQQLCLLPGRNSLPLERWSPLLFRGRALQLRLGRDRRLLRERVSESKALHASEVVHLVQGSRSLYTIATSQWSLRHNGRACSFQTRWSALLKGSLRMTLEDRYQL